MKLKNLLLLSMLLLTLSSLANTSTNVVEKLRFALIIDAPYAYYDKGNHNQLAGYNIDFAKTLAKSLNKQADFLVCPVARCFALMKNGEADILIDINKTVERETYLSYLPAYKHQLEPLRFFTRKIDNITIEGYSDLSNLTIGAIRGTSFAKTLQQNANIQLVPLTTQSQLIKMLHFGRIKAFIEREESLLTLPEYQEHKNEFSISPWQYIQETPSYLAVSKKSLLNNKLEIITEKLNELKRNGTIEKIFNRKKYIK